MTRIPTTGRLGSIASALIHRLMSSPAERGKTAIVAHDPADFFVLRTPLLPFDLAMRWFAASAGQDSGADSTNVQSKEAELTRRLEEFSSTSVAQEALFLASRDLYSSLLKPPGDAKSRRRQTRALLKYFLRMTGRATPFGIFAGSATGEIAMDTRLTVPTIADCRREATIDVEYIHATASAALRDTEIRDRVRFRVNTSLYRLSGQLRYTECRIHARRMTYVLSSAESSEYLSRVLSAAKESASRRDLAEVLTGPDIAIGDALEFIDELIDAQLLVPDFGPRVTGRRRIEVMSNELRSVGANESAAMLHRLSADIDRINSTPIGVGVGLYDDATTTICILAQTAEPKNIVQVDLFKETTDLTLNAAVAREILKGVEALRSYGITADPHPARVSGLKAFVQRFEERFEDVSVPLLEALDEENGVGYAVTRETVADVAPLLDGLQFPSEKPAPTPWTERDVALLSRIAEAVAHGRQEIEFPHPSAGTVPQPFDRSQPALPEVFSVRATISASSSERIDAGAYEYLIHNCSGPGVQYFGRFCVGDSRLEAHVRELCRRESQHHPKAVIAEIVHLPAGRVGNVILRPQLREYEIPFLARGAADESHQVPPNDILVWIDRGVVRLWSQRLQCEVIPRLSNAHAAGNPVNLPLYKFLHALQFQQSFIPLWSWGELEFMEFLPRVRCGRAILSLARWRQTEHEIRRLVKGSTLERMSLVSAYRERLGVPKYVLVGDGDNELPLDLDNPLCVDVLADTLRRNSKAVLKELFPAPDQLAAKGPEGRYVHECIVPFVAKTPVQHDATTKPPGLRLRRFVFEPGSEWLYVKIYTGKATMDRLLIGPIFDLVLELEGSQTIDSWFFLRYADPSPHVRLRLHGDPDTLATYAFPSLRNRFTSWVGDGSVARFDIDTFFPEVTRYGGPSSALQAARLFAADSRCVIEVLRAIQGLNEHEQRWHAGLRGVLGLLNSLVAEPEQRLRVLAQLRDSFEAEFEAKGSAIPRAFLGAKFRQERVAIRATLDPELTQLAAEARESIDRRDKVARAVGVAYALYETHSQLTRSLGSIVASFVHMHLNRLLRGPDRRQEFVLYDLLLRYLKSTVEQERARQSSQVAAALAT